MSLFFVTPTKRSSLARRATAGRLRRVRAGLYTDELNLDDEAFTHKYLWEIVGHYLPGAVITDRSARQPGQFQSAIFVDHRRATPLRLPGTTVYPRKGPGPLPGDQPFAHGLYLASRARSLLDNSTRQRTGKNQPARTLTRVELEEWIVELLQAHGVTYLESVRTEAQKLVELSDNQKEFDTLQKVIGIALSTQNGKPSSDVLRALTDGKPFDPKRVEAFQNIATTLKDIAPISLPVSRKSARLQALPFFEAYFSNYIEGSEFTVEEARQIVETSTPLPERPADSHDILGTFAIVSDNAFMTHIAQDSDEFLELLQSHHRTLLAGRPEMAPGTWKKRANRVGNYEFVKPDLVPGTLTQAWNTARILTDPFQRAVYFMFAIAEIHPFTDGNGRISRVFMNMELVSAGQSRIIVPTIYRNDYLAGLRTVLNAERGIATLHSILEFAWRYTARIDFTSIESGETDLERTNAFTDSTEAENTGVRLQLP